MAVLRGFFLLAVFASYGWAATYVLPYQLRLGNQRTPLKYAVLILLPETFVGPFGVPDGLHSLLANNLHQNTNHFVGPYVRYLNHWYPAQIEKHPEIYGEDTPLMVANLRLHHAGDEEMPTAVVTAENDLTHVLGLIRVARRGADGLLPTERDYLADLRAEHGLEGFPEPVAQWAWGKVVDLVGMPDRPDIYDISRSQPVTLSEEVEGENVEFMNLATDPQIGGRLIRHLYMLTWMHRMYLRGVRPLPDRIVQRRNGTPISANLRARMRRRTSHVYVGNYSMPSLGGLYEGLGFPLWKTLHPARWKRPVDLRRATIRGLQAKMEKVLLRTAPRRDDQSFLLVADPVLGAQLRSPGCGGRFLVVPEQAN